MDLNELEEAFPGSRSLALSEQRANQTHRGEKRKKYYDASQINSNSTSDCLFWACAPGAGGCPAAGWRLPGLQHG